MKSFSLLNSILVIMINSLPSLCVQMNEITLAGGTTYLRLQETKEAILECNYRMEVGDVVEKVSWFQDDAFIYSWSPQNPPAFGANVMEEDFSMTRKDGHLHYKMLKVEFSGNYKCQVSLSSGVSSSSHVFQLLIVDMPDHPFSIESRIEDCVLMFSWSVPAIIPKPNPVCGVWSNKYGFTRTATSWQATPYYNGSISYKLEDEPFDIAFMALDSVIKCEINITVNDTYAIQLVEKTHEYKEISERGCARLEVEENIDIEYDNYAVTCHNEIKPLDPAAPVIERRKCKDGYEPKYGDLVTMVELLCDGQKWEVGGGLVWNHVNNLICVPKEVYKPPVIPNLPTPNEKKRANFEQPKSGVGFLSPWTFIVFLCVVVSGTICGIKFLPRKKPTRFMD